MSDWLKRYWPAIVLSLALLLILDGTISSLETCHPPPNGPSSGQNSNENCTVFQGPLASLIVIFGNFFETHDKSIVAAFTVVLAVSTIGLWLATINLYKSGERQIRSSRQIAAIQARQTRQQLKLASAEFASTHRPKLILRQAFSQPQANGAIIAIQLVITNIGETNARIVESVAYLELIKSQDGLLLAPTSYGRNDFRTANQIFAPGQERPFTYIDEHGVNWSDEAKVFWVQPFGLHFVGRFVYVDEVTGVRRQTAFRRWYDRRAERFILIYENGTEHEYAD